MRSKEISVGSSEKTYVIVFGEGEDPAAGLLEFARAQGLTAAYLTAIGAMQSVTLGWFNLETREYERIEIDEQVEVLSLIGNVAVHNNEPKIHAHLVVGKRNGAAWGGHLLTARVRPTLEVMLVETPRHLRRHVDPATGLPLIDPDPSTLPPRRGRPVDPDDTSPQPSGETT
jgi:predicted DNA-binding protein with PD1-like motif